MFLPQQYTNLWACAMFPTSWQCNDTKVCTCRCRMYSDDFDNDVLDYLKLCAKRLPLSLSDHIWIWMQDYISTNYQAIDMEGQWVFGIMQKIFCLGNMWKVFWSLVWKGSHISDKYVKDRQVTFCDATTRKYGQDQNETLILQPWVKPVPGKWRVSWKHSHCFSLVSLHPVPVSRQWLTIHPHPSINKRNNIIH